MPNQRNDVSGWRMFERHVQTGVSSLILVAVIWGFSNLQQLQIEMTQIHGQLNLLSNEIKNLTWRIDEGSKDRYTRIQGADLERRVEMLENQFREVNK